MEIMINLPHETRISMGKKGRQKIQDEFSEDIVCDLYIDAIRSAVDWNVSQDSGSSIKNGICMVFSVNLLIQEGYQISKDRDGLDEIIEFFDNN